MNKKTHNFVVLYKWFELAYLLAMLVCMCVTIKPVAENHPPAITIAGCFLIVIAWYNFIFSTLVKNIWSNNCCMGFSFCCCDHCCRAVCEDNACTRQKKPNPKCLLRWTVQYVLFGGFIAWIEYTNTTSEIYRELRNEHGIFLFQYICIAYVCQHLILFALRSLMFLLWTVLTCCCDCD
jgi:hypothetical protein